MSGTVATNTNPTELARKLQSGGAIGFIMAVYETLKKLNRNYYYSMAIPEWIKAVPSPDSQTGQVEPGYFIDPQTEADATQFPGCIIYQYREYPVNRRRPGAPDNPGGARRQKVPSAMYYSDRPLPESEPDETDALRRENVLAFAGEAPLWKSIDDVPDIIRDHITPETKCHVSVWEYDVYVDFILAAPEWHSLINMTADLKLILKTFFERYNTGAHNLVGSFVQSISGAPSNLIGEIRTDVPCRTITWRLKQIEAYAFPTALLDEINLMLSGKT